MNPGVSMKAIDTIYAVMRFSKIIDEHYRSNVKINLYLVRNRLAGFYLMPGV
jgi:hypothetical protein